MAFQLLSQHINQVFLKPLIFSYMGNDEKSAHIVRTHWTNLGIRMIFSGIFSKLRTCPKFNTGFVPLTGTYWKSSENKSYGFQMIE